LIRLHGLRFGGDSLFLVKEVAEQVAGGALSGQVKDRARAKIGTWANGLLESRGLS